MAFQQPPHLTNPLRGETFGLTRPTERLSRPVARRSLEGASRARGRFPLSLDAHVREAEGPRFLGRVGLGGTRRPESFRREGVALVGGKSEPALPNAFLMGRLSFRARSSVPRHFPGGWGLHWVAFKQHPTYGTL